MELRQSAANALQFPIFIAVVVLAVAVRQFFPFPPNAVVLAVCAVALLLDVAFGRWALRNAASLFVSPDEITFSRHGFEGGDGGAASQAIRRTPTSSLSFRTARNGPMGSKYTGYVLKLRDNSTGDEVFAGAFGRRKVQEACESQGWTFA